MTDSLGLMPEPGLVSLRYGVASTLRLTAWRKRLGDEAAVDSAPS